MIKYLSQYRFSHIFRMIKNSNQLPELNQNNFAGRLVVISGATSGIGYETAVKYASKGADILCLNRNKEKSQALCAALKQQFNADCTYKIVNFSNLPEVHRISEELKNLDRDIDVLIHNAGTFLTRKTFTSDNVETVFQTNYLASFILNYRLMEKFRKQNSGRILFVNSEGHRFALSGVHLNDLRWQRHLYSGLKSYGAAKTAQLLSMIKFNDYFSGTNVTINAMHPGNVKSNMGQNNGKLYKFMKRILIDTTIRPTEIAAEALYFLGTSDKMKCQSGKFYSLTREEIPAPHALDKNAAELLWDVSLELGNLK